MRYAEYRKENLVLVSQEREGYNTPFTMETEMSEDEKREFLYDYDPNAEDTINELIDFCTALDNDEIKKTMYSGVNIRSAESWIKKHSCKHLRIKNLDTIYINEKTVAYYLFGTEKTDKYFWSTYIEINIEKEFHNLLYKLYQEELDYKKKVERENYEREHAEAIRFGRSLYEVQDVIKVIVPNGYRKNWRGDNEVNSYIREELDCSHIIGQQVIRFNGDLEAFNLNDEPLTIEQVKELEKLCWEYGKKIKEISERFTSKAKAIVDGNDW